MLQKNGCGLRRWIVDGRVARLPNCYSLWLRQHTHIDRHTESTLVHCLYMQYVPRFVHRQAVP